MEITLNQMSHKIGKYGWKKPTQRLEAPVRFTGTEPVGELPAKVDLRAQCPAVYDQEDLGSCTANAGAGAVEFDLLKQKLTDFIPSRLFIYYNERTIDGDIDQDAGSSLSTCVQALSKYGACPESEWVYDISKFAVQPAPQCYADGLKTLAVQYSKVANEIIPSVMKLCLAQGDPFIFGFTVYESFESAQVAATGIVPMPANYSKGNSTEQVVGGHAVMCVGYDNANEWFICRNSWGENWGDKGYFYIPYKYLTDTYLADDFWCVKVVS